MNLTHTHIHTHNHSNTHKSPVISSLPHTFPKQNVIMAETLLTLITLQHYNSQALGYGSLHPLGRKRDTHTHTYVGIQDVMFCYSNSK